MEKDNLRIEYLTSAFLERGLNAKERDELKALLQDPESKAYFKQTYQAWNFDGLSRKNINKTDLAFRKVLSQIEEEKRKKISPRIFLYTGIAASVAFLLGFAVNYLGFNNHRQINPIAENISAIPDNSINKIIVPLGSKTEIELPDGTLVTLNAGSKFEYPANYGITEREVKLEGEGYFKVAKNKNFQFIVKVGNTSIKALGTEFNVKAYSEEPFIQTTLVEGSVSINPDIKSKEKKPEIILKPNQMLTINGPGETILSIDSTNKKPSPAHKPDNEIIIPGENKLKLSTQTVNPILYTSWKDSRWIIEGETIEDLVLKLQRRYDVRITITSSALKRYKFSGILENETLEQVLDIMKTVAPINYNIDKKNVILSINPEQKKAFEKSMNNQ